MMEWDDYDIDNGCRNCHDEIANTVTCYLCEKPYCVTCFVNKHFIQYCAYCAQPIYCINTMQNVHFKCRSCYLSQRKTEEGKK